jgi:integrase
VGTRVWSCRRADEVWADDYDSLHEKDGWLVYETPADADTRPARSLADAIADVVSMYARSFVWDMSPHDLPRTFAKLARNGQAPHKQIQLALGHQSIQTTQCYLGTKLDLADADCDRFGVRLEATGA